MYYINNVYEKKVTNLQKQIKTYKLWYIFHLKLIILYELNVTIARKTQIKSKVQNNRKNRSKDKFCLFFNIN